MSMDASLENTLSASLACAQKAAQNKMYADAAAVCRSVLELDPDRAGALALLGTVCGQQGQVTEAIDLLERAIRINQTEPVWYANLCALYRTAQRPREAMSAAFAAVTLDSTKPPFLVNLALCYQDSDQFDEAELCVLRAMSLDPEDAAAHLVLAQLLLATEQWSAGWMEYEWRVRIPGQATPRMGTAAWNGMRLQGTLLLIADQGYGDTMQFSRYIALAAKRCREVHLFCSQEMAPLLGELPGVAKCITAWADLQPHIAHLRLSSLPWVFGTELSTIPEPARFPADRARAGVWRERLKTELGKGKLRVGLVWAGSTDNINDARRSLELSQLAPVFESAGSLELCWVSLQKVMRGLGAWDALPQHVYNPAADLHDFGDTAALIQQLDLVITVDTAVAHLSAGLGKPTWVLVGKAADWRWLLQRTDTPWYPTMRLFRQTVCGEWERPVREVAAALKDWAQPARPAKKPAAKKIAKAPEATARKATGPARRTTARRNLARPAQTHGTAAVSQAHANLAEAPAHTVHAGSEA